jgi:hypothetical protein
MALDNATYHRTSHRYFETTTGANRAAFRKVSRDYFNDSRYKSRKWARETAGREAWVEDRKFSINKQEIKAAAQARRPIVPQRNAIPRWLPTLVGALTIAFSSGAIVSFMLLAVETSSGLTPSMLGVSTLSAALILGTAATVKMQKRLSEIRMREIVE